MVTIQTWKRMICILNKEKERMCMELYKKRIADFTCSMSLCCNNGCRSLTCLLSVSLLSPVLLLTVYLKQAVQQLSIHHNIPSRGPRVCERGLEFERWQESGAEQHSSAAQDGGCNPSPPSTLINSSGSLFSNKVPTLNAQVKILY